jgi:hypothetical protein
LDLDGGLNVIPCKSRDAVLLSVVLTCMMMLFASSATAQDESFPRYDIFAGYQWLHPGGNVPFANPGNTSSQKLPDMPKGIGGSFTYNRTSLFGLEGDVGTNGASNNYLTTVGVGPRLMFRLEDC